MLQMYRFDKDNFNFLYAKGPLPGCEVGWVTYMEGRLSLTGSGLSSPLTSSFSASLAADSSRLLFLLSEMF